MSGALSEDVNHTVGQYGSVITGAIGGTGPGRCRPLLMSEPQTDLFLW